MSNLLVYKILKDQAKKTKGGSRKSTNSKSPDSKASYDEGKEEVHKITDYYLEQKIHRIIEKDYNEWFSAMLNAYKDGLKFYISPQLKSKYQEASSEYKDVHSKFMSEIEKMEEIPGMQIIMFNNGMGYRNMSYFETNDCCEFYNGLPMVREVEIGDFTIAFEGVGGENSFLYEDFISQKYLKDAEHEYQEAESKIQEYEKQYILLEEKKKELKEQLTKIVFGRKKIKNEISEIEVEMSRIKANILEEKNKQENPKKIMRFYKNLTKEQLIALQKIKKQQDLLLEKHKNVEKLIDFIGENSRLASSNSDIFISWMEKIIKSTPISEEQAGKIGDTLIEVIEEHLEKGSSSSGRTLTEAERDVVGGLIRYIYEKSIKQEAELTVRNSKTKSKR